MHDMNLRLLFYRFYLNGLRFSRNFISDVIILGILTWLRWLFRFSSGSLDTVNFIISVNSLDSFQVIEVNLVHFSKKLFNFFWDWLLLERNADLFVFFVRMVNVYSCVKIILFYHIIEVEFAGLTFFLLAVSIFLHQGRQDFRLVT